MKIRYALILTAFLVGIYGANAHRDDSDEGMKKHHHHHHHHHKHLMEMLDHMFGEGNNEVNKEQFLANIAKDFGDKFDKMADGKKTITRDDAKMFFMKQKEEHMKKHMEKMHERMEKMKGEVPEPAAPAVEAPKE